MYENFATKYRPQIFEDVKGQDAVIKTLSNSLKMGRIAHAYLFFGPRGCGKTSVARILAKALNCHKPQNFQPCNKCASCKEIGESKSLDVLEIDAASHTKVEQIREAIIESVNITPSRDKYKIYILDEVHMLSKSSFNALLKTVEEPPEHVVFIMATTEQTKVPATIISRCQSFRFKLINKEMIAERLKGILSKEKIKAPQDALRLISEASGGAMRDALTILDRCASFAGGDINSDTTRDLLGHVNENLMKDLAFAILDKNASLLHKSFIEISSEGYDTQIVLINLRALFAEAFLFSQGFSKNSGSLIKEISKAGTPAVLAKISRHLGIIIDETRFSDSLNIACEMALFTLIEKTVDIQAMINRLEALEGKITSLGHSHETCGNTDDNILKKKTVLENNCATLKENKNIHKESAVFSGDLKSEFAEDKSPTLCGVSYPATTASAGRQGATLNGRPKPHEGSPFVWKKLLGRMSSKRPVLYNVLASLKVVFKDEKTWVLSSDNKFDLETIKKNKKELEEIIEEIAGIKISIIVSIDSSENKTARLEEISNAPNIEKTANEADSLSEEIEPMIPPEVKEELAALSKAPPTEAGKWEELSSDDNFDSDPELKGLKKIFKGLKISKISKRQEKTNRVTGNQ
ncbi:MAG: DNA polymerase III subunit gamma/tau [Elusimicrobia bacterium]|nr:DNA polymerase III subunit gamma/tau [Elusimicrobiota bacterium]